MRKALVMLVSLVAATAVAAEVVDQKGFVYVQTGGNAVLRAEPRADSAEVTRPPAGMRLVHRKVSRDGANVGWYYVEQPGMKSGWLSASDASTTRPTTPAQGRPVQLRPELASNIQTSTALTAAARMLDARAGSGSSSLTEKEAERLIVQFTAWEDLIGITLSDPPYREGEFKGRYADTTARGRKEDAEKFLTTLKETQE